MTTLETKAKSGALTTPPALRRTLHALKVGLSTTKLILGYEVFKSLRLPAKEQETPDPKNSETVATKSESSFLQTIVDAAKYNITTAPLCAAAGTLTTVLYVSMPMAMSFASGWIVETITTKP
jgi:hypothetical protein